MLAVTWAVVVALAPKIDAMLKMNPVAEGAPAHGLYEVIVLLAVLSIVCTTCVIAYKRWPMFLSVHRDISWAAVLWRLIAVTPIMFVIIGLVGFSLVWLFVMQAEGPADPQNGLSAWWAGYYYALMLTPVITVTGVWLWLHLRYRR
ncbi:MAG: hypothetical protein Kow0060_21930 [Methylohalobius crimeensis]